MRLLIKVAPIYIFILAVECSDGEFYELVAGKVSPPAATTDQPGIKLTPSIILHQLGKLLVDYLPRNRLVKSYNARSD